MSTQPAAIMSRKPKATEPAGEAKRPERQLTSIKLDAVLVYRARAVVDRRNLESDEKITLGDYLAELAGPGINRDYKATLEAMKRDQVED